MKRRGSSLAKMTVENLEAVKEQFLIDIKAIMEMKNFPQDLVINLDQTAISILKGSKRVEIAGIIDKQQIAVVVCGTMTGKMLSFKVIYPRKTSAYLPHIEFPDGWHVTCTPNHWSNEEKMKEYTCNRSSYHMFNKASKIEPLL